MKQITIGFSKACTTFPIFSWLILFTQRTPYSHVYLKYQDTNTGRTMIAQASHTEVNTMGETVFLTQETVVQEFTFQVSDASFLAIQQWVADNLGKPYGVLEICGLAVVQLALVFSVKINNPVKDEGVTFVCDQLVAALLSTCEKVVLPEPINNMTPKDVYDMVSTLPAVLSTDTATT